MNTRQQPGRREMLRAVAKKDASYDGIFFTAVRTTGIFCRPSCPARRPKPENVEFYPTTREALFAGYRPCRRCRPLDVSGRPPGWVRALLSRVEKDPTTRLRDGDLRRMSIDPARARRYFQRHYGMTFHAYQRARRLGDALFRIRRGDDLNTVALGHGFESPSGFRDAFARMIGRPPGKSRQRDCIVTTMIESPLGPLLAAATSDAVCLLEFTDRRALEVQFEAMRRRFDRPVIPGSNAMLSHLRRELSAYFAGSLQQFSVSLTYPGTPFQEAVWSALRRIPFGETISYEDLARDVGRPGACRAVGTANGANRIAIVIPCHRVVNKDGKLGGYGGGLWRKRFLLDLEAASSGQTILQFDDAKIPVAG